MNVATNDHMACMHTVHPAAYVTFKRWLAGKPEREALKRRCDALQADAVQTLLDDYLPLLWQCPQKPGSSWAERRATPGCHASSSASVTPAAVS